MTYWSQYSTTEILSMHGIETDEAEYLEQFEEDAEFDKEESEEQSCDCPHCKDNGCNYCLMCEY